jgi:hypothetical protein
MIQLIYFNDTTKVFYYFTPLYIYRHTVFHCNLISHASELPNVQRSCLGQFHVLLTQVTMQHHYYISVQCRRCSVKIQPCKTSPHWPQKHPVSSKVTPTPSTRSGDTSLTPHNCLCLVSGWHHLPATRFTSGSPHTPTRNVGFGCYSVMSFYPFNVRLGAPYGREGM